MPLPSGAHVKLGSYEYLLDEGVAPHYEYSSQGLQAPQPDTGEPGAAGLRSDTLRWPMTDWVGGEGNRRYFTDAPDVYDYSTGCNPRIRGQVTGRPTLVSTTITGVTASAKRPLLTAALGAIWLAGSRTIAFSTDNGLTWTKKTASGVPGIITALAGEHDAVYVAHYGAEPSRSVLRHTAATAGGTDDDVISLTLDQPPFIGAAMMDGRLYLWTGRKLYECDVGETLPLVWNDTWRKVDDNQADLTTGNYESTSTGGWWAGCAAGDNSVVYFTSSEGRTAVREFKYVNGEATPKAIWNLPMGFTGRDITVANGIVFMVGHFGLSSTADGYGALYALPLNTRQPLFLGYLRKQQGTYLHMDALAPSYGAQVLVADKLGKVFVYDAEFNSISLLSDLALTATAGVGSMLTSGTKRIVACYTPGAEGTTYTIYAYNDDETRESVGSLSYTLDSGTWDFDQPHVSKGLAGFHVVWQVEGTTTSGLLANQRITVSYAADGGSYVNCTPVTSATTPSSGVKGRHFVAVTTGSSTPKFHNLKVRVTLDNNATNGVKPPILCSVTPEAIPFEDRETWTLALRCKDDRETGSRGDLLRDNLRTLKSSRAAVTFLDGYRYPKEKQASSSHVVFVDALEDVIVRAGEGTVRVRLVAVPT